ncbi:hypothetical protein [Thiobacillus sedimenti]|uniref:Uncharacterized protein n=1 Tax=Thiobacillus sedimenti TaxID=3110231 RepID=A0ABZ1CL29_9PROT|nr:hypothetical protein [Thiobacillus sp. SCUT-2]WRS39981.1 hypothetical protein VA613_03675 [Thiobacillus sp. SCUT-2]
MRLRTLLVLFALSSARVSFPAAADSSAAALLAAARHDAAATQACLARAKGDQLAQINCCSGHKGVCGCRAGKIICCDGSASTEPGCTCHGDEAITE